MDRTKTRRQIAWEAAKLMYERQESEYYRAKMKAAKRVCQGWVKPKDLPSNSEIRDQIQQFSRQLDGDVVKQKLLEMRLEALRMMRLLKRFRPKLIGSVLTGHVRKGSDIDLHVFPENFHAVTCELEFQGIPFDTQRKEITKHGTTQVYRHIHIDAAFPIELTVYAKDQAHYVFKSSITGKAMERASLNEWELLLRDMYPDLDLDAELERIESEVDPYQLYYSLLLPLENVKQDIRYHPEGDALYHSLQVFDLACDQRPYDEEFLAAALLHDVGKAIDAHDHVASGVEALEGSVSERTLWLIEHHMNAHKLFDRTIGKRARKRYEEHEYFDDLVLLGECDRAGRVSGIETSDLEAAIEYLRELAQQYR